MKAAYITETGEPNVIQFGDLPTPEPGPTQVLVKVGASAVNPIDTYIRSGAVPIATEFPYIVGCDLAGTVQQCGSEVTRFQPGDRVWGSNQSLFGRPGTAAQYAAVDQDWLYPSPDGMSDAVAAAGSLVGITAHLGLFLNANLQAGEILFVNGGTGGVGAAVVQLAKSVGARVIATVGSDEKQALCESWGADLVVNYHSDSMDQQIGDFATEKGGIDVWFETQRESTMDRTVELMAKRGRIVLMAGRAARPEFPVGPFYVKDLRMFGFAMFNASPEEQRDSAEAVNAAFNAGTWTPQIGQTFSLAQTSDAHALQEANTLEMAGTLTGKIVVDPSL